MSACNVGGGQPWLSSIGLLCTMLALVHWSPMLQAHLKCATNHVARRHNKKNDLQMKIVLVGLPGFEPRMTGPESVVLPLHHSPLFVFDGAKVEHFF